MSEVRLATPILWAAIAPAEKEAARAAKGVDHLHIPWGRVVAVSLSTDTIARRSTSCGARSTPYPKGRLTESSAST